MGVQDDLRQAIQQEALRIHVPDGVDPIRLLAALAVVESSFGLDVAPRHEAAYDIGGRYYATAQHVRDLRRTWGAWAACSYGPWQILFVLAWEVGFRGTPNDLWTPTGSIEWVIRALNARVFDKGAGTVEEAADAWNSGSFRDTIRPEGYIRRVVTAYARPDLLDGGG